MSSGPYPTIVLDHGVSKTPLHVSGHGSAFSSWRSTFMPSTSVVNATVSDKSETRMTQ